MYGKQGDRYSQGVQAIVIIVIIMVLIVTIIYITIKKAITSR